MRKENLKTDRCKQYAQNDLDIVGKSKKKTHSFT